MGKKARFRTLQPQEQLQLINRLCPCCGVDPQYTELGVTCDNLELADLGAGYVMYFKLVIFFGFLLIMFSVINVIKAISNTGKKYCVTSADGTISTGNAANYAAAGYPPCIRDWITVHSIANYGISNVDTQEKAWVFVFFLLYWFVLSGCKSYIKKTNKVIDINNDTPSDWTLIVKDLPKDEPAEQIKANFEAYGALGKMVCTVKKVNLAYSCSEYLQLEAKVNQEKRQMKVLQVKEMPTALKAMKEKVAKEGKKIVDETKMKPDKTCFSPEFQAKMQKLTEDTMHVGAHYLAQRPQAEDDHEPRRVRSRHGFHHILNQADC